MGQWLSRPVHSTSTIPSNPIQLLSIGRPNRPSQENPLSVPSSSNNEPAVTRPATPPPIRRISGIIEPKELLLANLPKDLSIVKDIDIIREPHPLLESPSGETVPVWEYLKSLDRPLGIKERQERIKLAVERAQANEIEASPKKSSRRGSSASPKKGDAGGLVGTVVGKVRSKGSKKGKETRTELTFEQAGVEVGGAFRVEPETIKRKKRGCYGWLGGCFGRKG